MLFGFIRRLVDINLTIGSACSIQSRFIQLWLLSALTFPKAEGVNRIAVRFLPSEIGEVDNIEFLALPAPDASVTNAVFKYAVDTEITDRTAEYAFFHTLCFFFGKVQLGLHFR